ncbi:Ark- serine/threonine protein kinase [Thecaphora frezii]
MNHHASLQQRQQMMQQHQPQQNRQQQQQQQPQQAAYLPHSYPHGGQMSFQQPAPYKGTLAPGTKVKVGNFTVTVKRYLSEGGFAHVYLVTTSQPIPMPSSVTGSMGASASGKTQTTRGETTHVLKRMAVPDKEALADVRREVEVHKLLRNQANIVHFIEASATALQGGGYEIFILMEYCAGGGIIDLMNARLRDRLREDEVLKIFGDVCAGVAVMHHQDPPLMHRDLKVENILMSPSVGPDSIPGSRSPSSNLKATFKLCDFGSAAPVLSRRAAKSMEEVKRIEADLNKHTTLQYRAPEMVDVYQRRVIDEKADIWALGVFLYKLCYYTTPFEENGGGPLAILNVQYRFPPQPVYSQKLKDLIASLLIEQSSQRPTIDQVIVGVHKILGTRPPSSVLHYANQVLSGKIAEPLPTVANGGAGAVDGVDIVQLLSVRDQHQVASSGDADLISIGPTRKEREDAEAQQLAKQTEGITPMRRGRPTKPGSLTSEAAASGISALVAPSAAAKPSSQNRPMVQLTGEKAEREPSSSASKNLPPIRTPAAAATTSEDGFGDSFRPSSFPSATVASLSPPSSGAPTPAPAFNISHSPASPVNLPPRPREGSGSSANQHLGPLNATLPMPPAGSPALSFLKHSPALPGFSAANSPSGSPLPRQNDTSMPQRQSASNIGDDESAVERFPSVEELDARYASPTPPTPQSAPTPSTAARTSVQIPGLSSRASVGALAGKINRANTVDAPSGPGSNQLAANTSTGSVLKRWQPPSSAPAGGSDHAKASIASPKATKPAGYRLSKLSSVQQGDGQNSPAPSTASSPSYRKLTPAQPSGEAPTSSTSSKKAKDWLTGDGSEDEAGQEGRPLPSAQQRPADAANGDAVKSIGQKPPSSYRSPARFDANPSLEPGRSSALQPVTSDGEASSDDEAEEPEDFEARRPGGPNAGPNIRLERRWTPSSNVGLSTVGSGGSPSDRQPIRTQPGRLKAPSWLADQRVDEQSNKDPSRVDAVNLGERDSTTVRQPSRQSSHASVTSQTRSEVAVNERLDAAARDAERKLEELLRGPDPASPLPSPTREQSEEPKGDPTPPPLPSRLRAPAWDEEEEEMKALPQPELQAASSHRPVETGNLVDFDASDAAIVPPSSAGMHIDRTPISSTSQQKWLQDLMDEAPDAKAGTATSSHAEPSTDDLDSLRRLNLSTSEPAKQPAAADTADATTPYTEDLLHLSSEAPVPETASNCTAVAGRPAVADPAASEDLAFSQRFPTLEDDQSGENTQPSAPTAQTDTKVSDPTVLGKALAMADNGASFLSTVSSKPSWNAVQSKIKPGLVRQRQQSLVGDQSEVRRSLPTPGPQLSAGQEPSNGRTTVPVPAANSTKIIMPKPTAVRPANSSHGRYGIGGSGAVASASKPVERLKPWEREAAAAAEISKSGIVRSSGLRGPSNVEDSDDAEDEPESASRNEPTEQFSGVSSLISKWQQNVESQAPGWGRVGGSPSSDNSFQRRSVRAGQGRGLGPEVANQAAASVHGRKAESHNA